MAKAKKRASKDALLEAAHRKVWAEFSKLDHDARMRRVVNETKRRLRALNCGHLSVHRGRGTAYGRLYIERQDGSTLSPKEMIAISEALEHDPTSRTNSISMWFIEAEMKLGLRRKKPLCSWCGSTFGTEREALECHKSH